MDFSKKIEASENAGTAVEVVNANTVKSGSVQVVSEVGAALVDTREAVKTKLINSGEVQALSDTLSVNDPQSIIEFGSDVATKLSKVSDEILKRQDANQLANAGTMMKVLTKIMDKVDIDEITAPDKKPGFLDKMMNNAQRRLEQLTAKYNNIGNEIEKVCVELRTYEDQIEQSNKDLERMYNDSIVNYEELVKYITAGEHAMEEVDAYIRGLEERASGDAMVAMELQNVNQAKQLLEQRLQDLRMAEAVAVQSLPIIKSIAFGNYNLARKINSSFIVTIPVFKNALAQSIMIKRQHAQAQALQALDEKTNEMILKNAQNAANNMRLTTQLAGSSAVKADTVVNAWQTIMDGIRDSKAITEELARQRDADRLLLEQTNRQYTAQLTSGR